MKQAGLSLDLTNREAALLDEIECVIPQAWPFASVLNSIRSASDIFDDSKENHDG